MSLQMEAIPHETHLEVQVSGRYDLNTKLTRFPSLLALCRETQSTKVLIDFRAVTGLMEATSKVLYALEVGQHYADHRRNGGQPLRIAYLGQAPLITTWEPAVKITREAGLPIDLFTDEAEARAWLDLDHSA